MRVLLFESQPLLVEALVGLFGQLNDDVEVIVVRDTDELRGEIDRNRGCDLAFLGLHVSDSHTKLH